MKKLFAVSLIIALLPWGIEGAATRKKRRRQPTVCHNENCPVHGRNRKVPAPTLKMHLSPAQIERKFNTFRRRINSAPEKDIPYEAKTLFLELFDDMVKTAIGRYIFEKAHPDISFDVKDLPPQTTGTYNPARKRISLDRKFITRGRNGTEEAQLCARIAVARVIAHETTHSIQYVNGIFNLSGMSLPEQVTIYRMNELNARLNEIILGEQMLQLAKYSRVESYNAGDFLFYRELKNAFLADGIREERAEGLARTKFVEAYWSNRGKTAIHAGNKVVLPTTTRTDRRMAFWNRFYSEKASEKMIRGHRPAHHPMRDSGITKNISQLISLMKIDSRPEFFTSPGTTAFRVHDPDTLTGYADGIKNMEVIVLSIGRTIRYYNPRGEMTSFTVIPHLGHGIPKTKDFTDFYENSRTVRATYSLINGKMK